MASFDVVRAAAAAVAERVCPGGASAWSRAWMLGSGVALLLAAQAAQAADLTPLETRWLRGAAPVITFAKESRLPLDIVVQPQPTPGEAPMAMAFVDGRCKLVLSMRGNPEAEAALQRVAPELQDAMLELVAAHELAHCRRHLDGAWYGLPAGLHQRDPDNLPNELKADYREMMAERREEGYADLVGLAWVQQRHPQLYTQLHAWLVQERSVDRVPGSHHDTLAWLRMASRDAGPANGSIFSGPERMWQAGLTAEP